MKKIVLFLLAALALPLWALPSYVKIDVDGRAERVKLTRPVTAPQLYAEHASWVKPEERQSYLAVKSKKPLSQQWQRYDFSFTPAQSGKVTLCLRGVETAKGVVSWTGYDGLEVRGAALANGSFENGKTGWDMPSDSFRSDGGIRGKNHVEAAQYKMVRQNLTVTKGKTVTLSFWCRAGKGSAQPQPAAKTEKRDLHHFRIYSKLAPGESYLPDPEKMVKLLPLSNKGFARKEIWYEAPEIKVTTPVPAPVFAKPRSSRAPADTRVSVPVVIEEDAGIARKEPVTFGLPVAQGKLFDVDHFQLKDSDGTLLPLQTAAAAFWPDRSVKWALLRFQPTLAKNEKRTYTVEFGSQITPAPQQSPLKIEERGGKLFVSTGVLEAEIDKQHFHFLSNVTVGGKRIGSFAQEGLELRTESGKVLTTSELKVRKFQILEQGAVKATLRFDGDFGNPKAGSWTVRMSFFANSARVNTEITFTDTDIEHEFSDYTSLQLRFLPESGIAQFQMDSTASPLPASIFLPDEKHVTRQGKTVSGSLSGAGQIALHDQRKLSFVLHDASCRYPKGFAADGKSLTFQLLPELPGRDYGADFPYYLRFPFCEGKYRIKWGMSFTEKLDFDFSGESTAAALAAPELVAVVDRTYFSSTKTFAGVVPAADHHFDAWDAQLLEAFQRHLKLKKSQREFGFFNYGDCFGERGDNWNNNEYDLAHGLFHLYARTGNRDVYRWAKKAARHQADVDIVHAYPDPLYFGTNNHHSYGHTGTSGVLPKSWNYRYNDNNWGNQGHTWSEGMTEAWCLAGDDRAMESALELGEHLTNYLAQMFKTLGTHERSAGWSIRALLGLYKTTGNPKYLKAAKKIADVALKEQKFNRGGAWPHKLPKDHAGGVPGATGNCPYLIGILGEGLYHYYLGSGDPRVRTSLKAAAGWLVSAWHDEAVGWPYSAAENGQAFGRAKSDHNLMGAPVLAVNALLFNDARSYEIASKVLTSATFRTTSPQGKALAIDLAFSPDLIEGIARSKNSAYRYGTQELLALLKEVPPAYRLRFPEQKEFRVTLKQSKVKLPLIRERQGSRPKAKPQLTIRVLAPQGKEVAALTRPTNQPLREEIELSGKKGDTFRVLISDDMTGNWTIPQSPAYRSCAVIVPGTSIAVANISEFILPVPAESESFRVTVKAVHPGSFQAMLIDPAGRVAGTLRGANVGESQLAWLNHDSANSPSETLTIRSGKGKGVRNYHLLLSSHGDLELSFDGTCGILTLPEK